MRQRILKVLKYHLTMMMPHLCKEIYVIIRQNSDIVRGQKHIWIRSRVLSGLLFLWIQLLVLFKRQEAALFSKVGHKNDMFATETEQYIAHC
ncbi:hypothetical protein GC097_30910 [Paenibacillus sp. LMG 31457]|uniref:Uncharacterized protein n=1 Tax=Paenibacillus planticolens TaxID=2654976 RepID=A0ABX1ZX32_9BACL|nr:hypothetical protein [Paenibacillus planticolens]